MKKKKRNITFGAIYWEKDEQQFIQVADIADMLEEHLQLTDFGKGLHNITFIPMGVAENDPIHQEKYRYNKAKKQLEIHKRLDMTALPTGSAMDFRRAVALLFLTAIKDEFPSQKIPAFELLRFAQAVERLFLEQGYLEQEVA